MADKTYGLLYPAQCLAVTANLLLSDDAAKAKYIISESKPYFKSKEEYLAEVEKLNMCKDTVTYCEDGTIRLDFKN